MLGPPSSPQPIRWSLSGTLKRQPLKTSSFLTHFCPGKTRQHEDTRSVNISLFCANAHTSLVRFDLIFLMLDPQDEAYDRRLAHHLVSLYYQSEDQIEEEHLDMAVLKDYIAYARTSVHPRLSEEASQALIEACQTERCSFVAYNIVCNTLRSCFAGLCRHA